MKNLSLVLSAFLGLTAMAAPVSPAQKKAIADYVKKAKKDYSGGHNGGSAQAGKYDVESFTVTKAIEEIRKSRRGSGCSYTIAASRRQVLPALRDRNDPFQLDEADLWAPLNDLYEQGLVKAIINHGWDGDDRSGSDSESCSVYNLDVYFEDGTLLSFDSDHTT